MENEEKLIEHILRIIKFLNGVDPGAYYEQMNYLNQLVDLNKTNNHDAFYTKINSAEMWGGAGALWESEYGMSTVQRRDFDNLLLELLKTLKELGKMGNGAKSIYKILAKNS